MAGAKPSCFFVMPFTPEFHYFYLYLRKHIEENHDVACERADEEVRTVSTWEKIRSMIQKADVIIANCTGRNANVFYELGMAHAYEKKIILVTSDPILSTPSNILHLDFIRYDHSNHKQFLDRLDASLRKILEGLYDKQFSEAAEYFNEFEKICPEARKAAKEDFVARYGTAELPGEAISPSKLLMFIVQNSSDRPVMEKLVGFVPRKKKGPT